MPAPYLKNGYTLVELLVVITILGLLSVGSLVYYKSLTSDKILLKAVDSIQTLLRTAQSNATSGFACGNSIGASTWSVQFKPDKTKMDLNCVDLGQNPGVDTPVNRTIRTLILENNIQVDSISATGFACSGDPEYPIDIFYQALAGTVSFASGQTGANDCIARSSSITLTLKNTDTGADCPNTDFCKTITVTKGGAINVQ